MTTIEIFKKNGKVIKYEAKGHVEYAEHGKDVVCAAVSVALQYPLIGMQEIIKVMPRFEMNSDGYLKVDTTGIKQSKNEDAIDILLDTMLFMLEELSKSYPEHIKLVVKEEI